MGDSSLYICSHFQCKMMFVSVFQAKLSHTSDNGIFTDYTVSMKSTNRKVYMKKEKKFLLSPLHRIILRERLEISAYEIPGNQLRKLVLETLELETYFS